MSRFLIRFAYVAEFLLALIAILMLWGLAGGQGHLDLMPWYDKLLLPLALAWVVVLATASAASRERLWNGTTVWCLVIGLLIAGTMAALTYYYHLHEDDEEDQEGGKSVAVMYVRPQAGKS